MSKKIIGITVGTQLPKPDFKQTDPTKGDFIKNKPDFDGVKNDVEELKTQVGDRAVSAQINDAVSQKSQVQMIALGDTEILPTLKIHKLTQSEYDQVVATGSVDENALYLTPDEELDLSTYATEDYVDNAIAAIPIPDVSGQIAEAITGIVFPVDSVNGKTGSIVLTASDVGALSSDTVIPSIAGLATEAYVNNTVAQKSQVQIITWEDDD